MIKSLAYILLWFWIKIITTWYAYYLCRLASVFLMICLFLLTLFSFSLFLIRFRVHTLKKNELVWIDSMLGLWLLFTSCWSVWSIQLIIKVAEIFLELFITLVNSCGKPFYCIHSKLQISYHFMQFLDFLLMNHFDLSQFCSHINAFVDNWRRWCHLRPLFAILFGLSLIWFFDINICFE